MIQAHQLQAFIDQFWETQILPSLIEYIRIPCKSPHFEADWESKGYLEEALRLAQEWIEAQKLPGSLHIKRLPGRTPLMLIEVPGSLPQTVLMYGHLDKQPEMTGWRSDLGPWKPVIENGKLYGRGGSDDGYSLYASIAAIKALHDQDIPHARIVILIEFSEESGSPDLPPYIEAYHDLIGQPDFVIGLDSCAGNYEQMWVTTSLRGLIGGTLKAEVLEEGVHSGDASGVVPSSFRVLRQILDRLEDAKTGQILPPIFQAEVPAKRLAQIEIAAQVLGAEIYEKYPFAGQTTAVSLNPQELLLNRTWRPALSITGQDGMPPCATGGNVLRPFTTLKLSLRLPPTVPAEAAASALTELLQENPPYGAKIESHWEEAVTGWDSPEFAPWLEQGLQEASMTYYGKPAMALGEGVTIPFMGMLGQLFPEAQFVVTGVLGPQSNAHGPNEFLHLPYVQKLTACIAHLLAAHADHWQKNDQT